MQQLQPLALLHCALGVSLMTGNITDIQGEGLVHIFIERVCAAEDAFEMTAELSPPSAMGSKSSNLTAHLYRRDGLKAMELCAVSFGSAHLCPYAKGNSCSCESIDTDGVSHLRMEMSGSVVKSGMELFMIVSVPGVGVIYSETYQAPLLYDRSQPATTLLVDAEVRDLSRSSCEFCVPNYPSQLTLCCVRAPISCTSYITFMGRNIIGSPCVHLKHDRLPGKHFTFSHSACGQEIKTDYVCFAKDCRNVTFLDEKDHSPIGGRTNTQHGYFPLGLHLDHHRMILYFCLSSAMVLSLFIIIFMLLRIKGEGADDFNSYQE